MSKTNEEIAETIKTQMGGNPEITGLQVKGKLLQLHVTEPYFNRLSADRERGRKIVLVLLEQMKKLTGLDDVWYGFIPEMKRALRERSKPGVEATSIFSLIYREPAQLTGYS